MAGLLSNAETLISACSDAGVIFRRPKNGRLNPIFRRGEPPRELFDRVKPQREAIVQHLEGVFASLDELRDDAQAECLERGACGQPDLCPWFYECQTRKAQKC